MRKAICIILILTLFPLPALGFSWDDGKPIERPYIHWNKEKILATRDRPEILLGAFVIGSWILLNTKAGKAFYKANLKGDFGTMSKVAKQHRRVRIK